VKYLIIFTLFTFSISVFAQRNEKCVCSKNDKPKVNDYFENLDNQNKKFAECEEQSNKQPKIIIAGGCEFGSDGCPVNLTLPKFPKAAEKFKTSNQVKVEVIIDEDGKVIYSRMIEGKKIFKSSAEQAACKSKFRSVRRCGVAVKSKLYIVYNFIKD
jgi:hypothetical protein